jgi:exosortase D (VPLPA-CTERM-specific)
MFVMKNQLITLFLTLAIGLCFIFGFWPVLQKLHIRWNNGDNSYCYLVIPLFFYLLWEKRKQLRISDLSWNIWGLIPLVFGLFFMLIGELGSVETILYVGLWVVIVSLLLILYGMRLRHILFPLLILLFIVPLPAFINRMLTFKLKLVASSLSAWMLKLAGISVFQNGNIIDLGVTQLQVVDACSGLRYFIPLILMALLIGYFFSITWWHRLFLLLTVPPLSVFMNSTRIFITGVFTAKGHPELGQDFFHNFSGWLIYLIASGVLVIIAFLLKKIGPNKKKLKISNLEPNTSQRSNSIDSIDWIRPVLLTITLCVLIFCSGWALKVISSARNLPQRTSFESFPTQIGQWQGQRHYFSNEINESVGADDYVNVTLSSPGFPNQINLLIQFYAYQRTRHTAHAPQSCMLGTGWALFDSCESLINLNPLGKIKIMNLTWQKDSEKLLQNYFFLQRGRVITSPWMNKFYLMLDAFIKRRTDGAIVRVEMAIAPDQTINDACTILEGFIVKLWPILPEYVPD